MPTIEARLRRFACVIEAQPHEGVKAHEIMTYGELETCCKELAQQLPCHYWAILHDNDFNEDGEMKKPHIHLVIECNTRHTFLGALRAISGAFLVDQDRVSVRECRQQPMMIRYLMHMDDPEKTPYCAFDVVTDDPATLNQAITSPTTDLTIDELISAITKSDTPLDLIRRIGLKNFKTYQRVIQEITPYVKSQGSKKPKADN